MLQHGQEECVNLASNTTVSLTVGAQILGNEQHELCVANGLLRGGSRHLNTRPDRLQLTIDFSLNLTQSPRHALRSPR
jgi:hypothetical protein